MTKLNLVVIFFIVSLILGSFFLQSTMAAPSVCDNKCAVRCSKAGRQNRCLNYCGICCLKCKGCVPSGTYGNKSECPCYANMKNSKGTSKCP